MRDFFIGYVLVKKQGRIKEIFYLYAQSLTEFKKDTDVYGFVAHMPNVADSRLINAREH